MVRSALLAGVTELRDLSPSATLLVNLGSPSKPTSGAVRRYLGEFLSDPRVFDAPAPVRLLLLHSWILPIRSKKSAQAYRKIWTARGSPLLALSRSLLEKLRRRTSEDICMAMRYGEPSIPGQLDVLLRRGLRELLLIPLYPHYAQSSYETVVERVKEVLHASGGQVRLRVQEPFFDDPGYIESLVETARPALAARPDHLLFSFHGVPERHIRRGDPTRRHCLRSKGCCSRPGAAGRTCYRYQCLQTAELFAERAGIPPSGYSVSFQSRLGPDAWLGPATADVLVELPRRGVERLAVICPAFVTDCLETLEEIDIRGRQSFLKSGGREFLRVPCLNDHAKWVETILGFIGKEKEAP